MTNFRRELEETIIKVQCLLNENREDWEDRYVDYANSVIAREKEFRAAKDEFNQWKPLFVYTNLNKTMAGNPFQLRYRGQHIASLQVDGKSVQIRIESDQKKSNQNNFPGCPELSGWQDWKSKEAQTFRAFFKKNPVRNDGPKGNEEHRIESALLSALEEEKGRIKLEGLPRIQPVKMFGIARFQFPTLIAASNTKKIEYLGSKEVGKRKQKGGGIDILARTTRNICVLELKPKSGNISNVLQQGLAYAVFIRELLRSKSGEKWYRLFGFGKGKSLDSPIIPSKLTINVVAVMRDADKVDVSLAKNPVSLSLGGDDKAVLHYMYFTESDDKKSIAKVRTSLKKCPAQG